MPLEEGVGEFHSVKAAVWPGILFRCHTVFEKNLGITQPWLKVRLAEQGSGIAVILESVGDGRGVLW